MKDAIRRKAVQQKPSNSSRNKITIQAMPKYAWFNNQDHFSQ